MRDVKELLILLKDSLNIQTSSEEEYGMCIRIDHLRLTNKINIDEFVVLIDFLEDNRPESVLSNSVYWFDYDDKKTRIKWLEHHINKL